MRLHPRPLGLTGLLFAVLALVSQLVLGGLALPDEKPSAAIDTLAAVSTLCHAPALPNRHHGAPHAPAATGCTLAIALALPGIILTDAILLPLPADTRLSPAMVLPPARAPPPRIASDGAPRGPPLPN